MCLGTRRYPSKPTVSERSLQRCTRSPLAQATSDGWTLWPSAHVEKKHGSQNSMLSQAGRLEKWRCGPPVPMHMRRSRFNMRIWRSKETSAPGTPFLSRKRKKKGKQHEAVSNRADQVAKRERTTLLPPVPWRSSACWHGRCQRAPPWQRRPDSERLLGRTCKALRIACRCATAGLQADSFGARRPPDRQTPESRSQRRAPAPKRSPLSEKAAAR
mmetsp:Transcript_3392/g.9731  ORF Transcript_3392/g.9731 Transcript_3392/m.9731 type:complete len:215 (+) Transcript_3392:66-710(+)